jgi:hypothetical protein
MKAAAQSSSPLTKKQQAKLFKVHGITAAQWGAFNPIQQQALIVAGANRVDVTQEGFTRLGTVNTEPDAAAQPEMQFRDLGADEEAEFRKWARDNYKCNEPINQLWHPVTKAECVLMNQEVAAEADAIKEPSVDDLGANTVGKRKSSGPRTGAAMGAKPHVRMLLGTANPDGKFPLMTMEDICNVTKKSQINIRTILSDLRSPKYCGTGGVFMTTATKVDGKTYYQYVPPAA